MNKALYFDYAATCPPDEEIAQKALALSFKYFANPSSSHDLGKQAAKELQHWRQRAAQALQVQESQIFFTSGATEANQIILFRLLLNKQASKAHIAAALFEHASIHENLLILQSLGHPISWVKPTSSGHIAPEGFLQAINPQTRLATIMLINNETGAIQNVQQIIEQIRSLDFGKKVHIHVDATQAPGRTGIDLKKIGCDSACFSSHKMGGPRGAGILYLAKPIPSLFAGGGQESGIRAGTENLFAIIGCVLALEKTLQEPLCSRENEAIWIKGLQELGATFLPAQRASHREQYSPCIISFAFPPLPAEVLMRMLSEKGVYANTGSACGKHKQDRTRVLTSMGISKQIAECAIRISFDPNTSQQNCLQALDILSSVIKEQKKLLHF